jgi:CO dehydrogenase/acetyl-CoA synthase delta subunit
MCISFMRNPIGSAAEGSMLLGTLSQTLAQHMEHSKRELSCWVSAQWYDDDHKGDDDYRCPRTHIAGAKVFSICGVHLIMCSLPSASATARRHY